MAVYCQTRPEVPLRRPTWKQSKPTSSPGRSTSMWRSGSGSSTLGTRWCGVAGHQGEAADAPREAMAAQDLPDPARRDDDAAPARLGQGGADPPRSEPRMGDGEGEDAGLDDRRELVGHPRRPAFPRAQHLEAGALDHVLPAVVGRAVDPEDPTGLRDARPPERDRRVAGESRRGRQNRARCRSPCSWR